MALPSSRLWDAWDVCDNSHTSYLFQQNLMYSKIRRAKNLLTEITGKVCYFLLSERSQMSASAVWKKSAFCSSPAYMAQK